jgi:hypothetical protein
MSWRSVGVGVGRGLLVLLTVIHLVLPWTPANNSDDGVILVGALVIGGGFLATAVWSRRNPRPALTVGAILFLAVETVAAATGASPWEEGWPIKLTLSLLFAFALAAVWLPTRT